MNTPNLLFLEANRVWRTYPGGMKLDRMEGKTNPEDTRASASTDWL